MDFVCRLDKLQTKAKDYRRLLIEAEMTNWIACSEQEISDSRRFSFCDHDVPDEVILEKQERLRSVQVRRRKALHRLAMQISASASEKELDEMDMNKPSQILGWAIKQAKSPRWSFVAANKAVHMHFIGSNDIDLEPFQPLE